MILFGTYTLKIKQIPTTEFGKTINDNQYIDVRQRCFHVIMIPAFPVGKTYYIKNDKGETVGEASKEIKREIKKKHKARTPWYSFILLYIGIGAFVYTLIDREIHHREVTKKTLEKNAIYHKLIDFPTKDDYYAISFTDSLRQNVYTVTKVLDYTEDEITLQLPSHSRINIKNILSMDDAIKAFESFPASSKNIIKINKNDLKNTLEIDYFHTPYDDAQQNYSIYLDAIYRKDYLTTPYPSDISLEEDFAFLQKMQEEQRASNEKITKDYLVKNAIDLELKAQKVMSIFNSSQSYKIFENKDYYFKLEEALVVNENNEFGEIPNTLVLFKQIKDTLGSKKYVQVKSYIGLTTNFTYMNLYNLSLNSDLKDKYQGSLTSLMDFSHLKYLLVIEDHTKKMPEVVNTNDDAVTHQDGSYIGNVKLFGLEKMNPIYSIPVIATTSPNVSITTEDVLHGEVQDIFNRDFEYNVQNAIINGVNAHFTVHGLDEVY